MELELNAPVNGFIFETQTRVYKMNRKAKIGFGKRQITKYTVTVTCYLHLHQLPQVYSGIKRVLLPYSSP